MNRIGATLATLFALVVLGLLFYPEEQDLPAQESRSTTSADSPQPAAEADVASHLETLTEQELEPEVERVEVVAPEQEVAEESSGQLVIHGKAVSGEVAVEDMLVRLVIFDFEPGRETRFQYNDPSTWENASRTLFSKPRPVDADGSFVLSGNPPVPTYEGRRRYAVVISMDVGGNGIPMRDGESIIPLAMSAMLVGDEHPEGTPLFLEVPRPYQVTIEAHFPPELIWSLSSIPMRASIRPKAPFNTTALMSVATEADPRWTTSVSRLLGGLKFSFWEGFTRPVDVISAQSLPVLDSDLTFALNASAMGHVVARAPSGMEVEELRGVSPSYRSIGVQYRIIPLIDDEASRLKWSDLWQDPIFNVGLEMVRSLRDSRSDVRPLVEIMRQPDLDHRLHRALLPNFKNSRDADPMTYFNLGWIHEGQVELEIKDPQGGIWTSGPITIRSGDSLVVDMTRVDQRKLVTFSIPSDLIAYRPQDARFVFEDGSTEHVDLQREGVPSTGHWVWKAHVPPGAKRLIARGVGKEPHHVHFVTARLPETLPHKLALEVLPTQAFLDLPRGTGRGSSFYMGRTDEAPSSAELPFGGMRLQVLDYSQGIHLFGLPPGRYGAYGFVVDEMVNFEPWQGEFVVR